jgi:hypothetical protein
MSKQQIVFQAIEYSVLRFRAWYHEVADVWDECCCNRCLRGVAGESLKEQEYIANQIPHIKTTCLKSYNDITLILCGVVSSKVNTEIKKKLTVIIRKWSAIKKKNLQTADP